MLNNSEVSFLLSLEKKVFDNNNFINTLDVSGKWPFQYKFTLSSPQNTDYLFLYDINQSAKNRFKITLYLMDSDSKIGLLRVDFHGQHKNPEQINEHVPEFLKPYAGMFFDYHQHHIHIYVKGYKTTLDWAMPLTNHEFAVKNISSQKDILDAFGEFNKYINLKTSFEIQLASEI
ncbi:MAG: hypothetical protein KatS3mg027_0055 [Bacteroidia bacterium]|nr:MAG: hypothetical protein KatS3mg027_0055 [Bacteroidia bacterium]